MAIEINIKPEDVDALVKDAIMKSAFGKTIQDAINKVLNAHSYNSPIEDVLKKHISDVAKTLMQTEWKEKLDNAVRSAIAARLTDAHLQKISDEAINRIVRAAEDR